MRRLVLLSLVALAAFPLSAHGRWHRPRRVVVAPAPGYRAWDEERWIHRDRYRDDCEAPRVVYRPLPPPVPPFRGRVELWIR